jgi:desulfoferrodoxin (superoxide reductase-like protein)
MTEQKTEIPVIKIKTRERESCRKTRGVTVKVAAVKFPMPRHIILRIKLKDGTERIAKAHLVSTYNNYAYYFLYASYVDEIMSLINQIQEVKAYEKESVVQ